MQALLLAAGLGTRLRPLTEKLAKPALSFLNVPMLGFPLFWLEKADLKHLVINTHHVPDSVEVAAQRIVRSTYSLKFSFEPEILGGGGALLKALNLFNRNEPIVIINGDSVVLAHDNNILQRALEFHQRQQSLATIVCTEHPDVGTRFGGVFVDSPRPADGYSWATVKKFSKTPLAGLRGLHYVGALIVSPELFKYLPDGNSDILYDVISRALGENKKVLAFVDSSLRFFETGDPASYLNATKQCLELLGESSAQSRFLHSVLSRFTPGWDNYKNDGYYSFTRATGNALVSPSTRGLMGRAVALPGKCNFKGFFVVGDGAKISPGASIENAVVLPQAEVPEGESLFEKIYLK